MVMKKGLAFALGHSYERFPELIETVSETFQKNSSEIDLRSF
jgi:hypothetical protein